MIVAGRNCCYQRTGTICDEQQRDAFESLDNSATRLFCKVGWTRNRGRNERRNSLPVSTSVVIQNNFFTTQNNNYFINSSLIYLQITVDWWLCQRNYNGLLYLYIDFIYLMYLQVTIVWYLQYVCSKDG